MRKGSGPRAKKWKFGEKSSLMSTGVPACE